MTPIRLGHFGAALEPTRRFRIAKSPAVPWDEVTWRHFGSISIIRRDSHSAAIRQRALRHSFYIVPSNLR
jgi:hypothetical protein